MRQKVLGILIRDRSSCELNFVFSEWNEQHSKKTKRTSQSSDDESTQGDSKMTCLSRETGWSVSELKPLLIFFSRRCVYIIRRALFSNRTERHARGASIIVHIRYVSDMFLGTKSGHYIFRCSYRSRIIRIRSSTCTRFIIFYC